MRAANVLMFTLALSTVALSRPLVAQEPLAPASLADAVRPGQLVIVTDESRRETKGIVTQATETMLMLEGRTFAASDIYLVRKTDPLGNGTAIGAGAGVGLTVALIAVCGRYDLAEERGPCLAGAVVGGGLAIGLGAFIGRQIDRTVGERELYRRPPARTARLALAPVWHFARPGIQLAVTISSR